MKTECGTCDFYYKEHCCNGLSDMCTEAVSKDDHCEKWEKKKIMTNYEMVKSFSIEDMALSIMCPSDMGHMIEARCDRYGGYCGECCLDWLNEEVAE